jgi:hypothetical protein
MANPHAHDSDSDDEQNVLGIGGGAPVNLGQLLLHLAGGHVAPRARGGNNAELLGHMRANGTITRCAGGRAVPRPRAAGSMQLASSRRSDKVLRAMSLCPRAHFVPRRHAAEAYIDMPIRVEQHGFNISAPHMHATALEALDIQPGDRVLDVGCGCGAWTACAAYLVRRAAGRKNSSARASAPAATLALPSPLPLQAGPTGQVVGVDIREACTDMCSAALASLRQSSPE